MQRTRLRLSASIVLVLLAVTAIVVRHSLRKPDLPVLSTLPLEGAAPFVQNQFKSAYAALQARPGDLAANVKVASLLHAYRFYELAAVGYRRASLLAPDDFRWVYLLGMAQASAGARAEATATFSRAITLDEKNYLPARLNLSLLLVETGELERAAELLNEVLEQRPDLALAQHQYGRVLLRQGQPEEAIDRLRRAVELEPRFGVAHYTLALAYRELNDEERAQQHLELHARHRHVEVPRRDQLLFEVQQLNDGPAARRKRAEDLATTGKPRQAIAEFERVLEIAPDDLGAHAYLILLHGSAGELEISRKYYHRALELNPGWSEGHAHFGAVLAQNREYGAAVRALRASIQGNPYNARTHAHLGNALEGLGELEQAKKSYRRALENEPDHVNANTRLGHLLLEAGDGEKGDSLPPSSSRARRAANGIRADVFGASVSRDRRASASH